MKRSCCALLLIALLALPCRAATRENSCHTMAAGTFGVAMIGPTGEILVSDGRTAPKVLLPGVKAARLVAADLTGDGRDELAFLDVGQRSLFYYDFTTRKTAGGYGSNVNGLAAGQFLADDRFQSIVAGTTTAVPYRWTIEIGDQHWHELPGDFVEVVRADTDTANRVDEFAVISRGDVYVYHPIWQAYKQVLLSRDARTLIAGDLTASPGEEILVACGEQGTLWLCQKRKQQPLEKSARCMAVGKIDDAGVQAFIVSSEGVIERYDRTKNAFDATFAQKNTGWTCLLLADTDGDPTDEIYAVKSARPDALYRFEPSQKTFEPLGE